MRNLIQIVESGQDYMFHATRADSITGIAERGLVPNGQEPNWDGYPVDGRLYVSTTESGADWYAAQLQDMYDEPTVVLRFPPVPTTMDDYGNGPSDQYTASSVSPEMIEVKTESGWERL